MRAIQKELEDDTNMQVNFSSTQLNPSADEQAAGMAVNFLRELQSVSGRLNQFEKELSAIAESAVRLEHTAKAACFADQLWQLNGHRRFAEIQVRRLRALLNPALLAYPSPQGRIEAINLIRKQIGQTESALREVRLFWRELSATYHFMLGINGILV